MRTEVFIENNKADISADISSLITFAIDDVADFSARQTSFSKTIILPGTSGNNKLLGHVFQIGQSNAYDATQPNFGYNFNASKSASCIIFQDNIQTFKGVLRLMQINIDKGRPEYEVSVFGDLFSLNVALTSGKLEDLDFSRYNTAFTIANVVGSWDSIDGSGVYFPLIDYGTYSYNKKDWDIRTFRPALYVKEYIDKMFAASGFTYECDLFGTARFKSQVVPFNKKTLLQLSSPVFNAYVYTPYNALAGSTTSANVKFNSFTANGFIIDGANEVIKYISPDAAVFNVYMSATIKVGNGAILTGSHMVYVDFVQNGTIIETQPYNAPIGISIITLSTSKPLSVSQNDTFNIIVRKDNPTTLVAVAVNAAALTGATDGLTYNEIVYGAALIVNDTIPKNIRQIDFLVSIVKLYNLYVYEDKFNSRLIHIKPYVDFYGTDNSDSVDWTYKLDRNKPITLKPMSELNAKIYEFKLKQDSDYYNDLYSKRYGQDYGSYIYDSQYEFTAQKNSFELIFSPTPLVGYTGEDKVYSTIFKRTGTDNDPTEERTDSNIRILQVKKVTGVTSYDIKDGATVLTSVTNYGYAGHFNDPDAPSDDLNFGALQEIFFELASGELSNDQFNIYWSAYMAEITDKDSKLLTAYFYLKPKDIFDLDFSKYITVDGTLFRLNKITDYNMSNPDTCQVELLKVNFTNY
jgi:hypothetical protein